MCWGDADGSQVPASLSFATTLKYRLSSYGYFDINGDVTSAGKTVASM
jgi:hypothetical protein